MKKKIMSIAVIISLIATELYFGNTTHAMENSAITSEIVYVDGNKIKVTVDLNKRRVISQAAGNRDESYLEIDANGEGTTTIFDEEEGEYIDYELDIDELSYEDVEIDVIDEMGDIAECYNDYEDIVEDRYEEQAVAVTVVTGITVGTLITAILEVAACIVVAGIVFYGAKAAVAYIKKKSEQKKYYYKAYIYEKNVFINLSSKISRKSAVKRIRLGKNVYTYTSSRARAIVLETGLGCTGAEISDLKGKIRFYHYHTANRNKAHSFYGEPITY